MQSFVVISQGNNIVGRTRVKVNKRMNSFSLSAVAISKGGEIRDTKTLNLSRNIVSLQVLVDVHLA